MNHTSASNTIESIRWTLGNRLAGYQLLVVKPENLTPLFNKELQNAIVSHEEMLQRPDPAVTDHQRTLGQLAVLDNIDSKLSAHWLKLHSSLSFRTTLLASFGAYTTFLTSTMLLDYAGKSPRVPAFDQWALTKVDDFDKHQGITGGKSDEDEKLFQETVAYPLKEMMLNQAHVERRIRIAVADTGEVYRLIDHCDWAGLATILVHDRELAVGLEEQEPPESDNAKFCRITLREMDKISDKYFAEFSSATTYTLSKRARELSAKRAAGQAVPSEASPGSAEGDRAVSKAKGVYHRLIGSLRLGGSGHNLGSLADAGSLSASQRASMDSTTRLLEPDKKTT